MTLKDFCTVLALAYGLVFATIGFVFFRRNNSNPSTLPWLFGIGGALYSFVSLMTGSILQRPAAQIFEYTVTNVLLSLAIGVVGIIGGQRLAQRMR